MADIALVSLALDSSAVVAGEKQATRALHLVETAMQRTEKQSAQLNAGLNANVKKSGDAFKSLGDSASRAGSALSGLGGPVGRVGGEIASLGGQLETLVGSMGLVGGGAAAAAVGVVALGAALVRLTLQGVAVSDEMGDIAESTGLTIDQVQRLGAAAKLSGEDIGLIERSFRTFQSAITSAVQDPSGEAAQAFATLGINAKKAGEDVGGAFVASIAKLKEFSSTTAGATAASELFGRGIGSLIRSSDNLQKTLGGTRKELEDAGVIAPLAAVEAAGRLDAKINQLNNTWTVFTQNLAGTSIGAIIETSLQGSLGTLGALLHLFLEIEKNPIARLILLGVGAGVSGAGIGFLQGGRRPGAPADIGVKELPVSTTAPGLRVKELPIPVKAGIFGDPFKVPDKVKAGRAGLDKAAQEALRAEQALQKLRLEEARQGSRLMQEQWDKDLADLERFAKELNTALVDGLDTTLVGVGRKVAEITKGVPLAVGGAPAIQPGGLVVQPTGPAAKDIRTEEQARIDAQFDAIFDDMLISIITAQKTLGGAFAGLALGIVDIFAAEFTKSLRESFITPLIRDLTDFLSEGLKDLFSGLKGSGGLKGVFGGIVKGIGSIFGGFFASGGTLGPGKFGIAGERGPELIFAGNQPMHIAPVTAGSAGNVFNISVGVNAPSGTVDKRTQDQLAATVMNAVKRAQRNEGAR